MLIRGKKTKGTGLLTESGLVNSTEVRPKSLEKGKEGFAAWSVEQKETVKSLRQKRDASEGLKDGNLGKSIEKSTTTVKETSLRHGLGCLKQGHGQNL
jgi:hypothetical protein